MCTINKSLTLGALNTHKEYPTKLASSGIPHQVRVSNLNTVTVSFLEWWQNVSILSQVLQYSVIPQTMILVPIVTMFSRNIS